MPSNLIAEQVCLPSATADFPWLWRTLARLTRWMALDKSPPLPSYATGFLVEINLGFDRAGRIDL